MRIAVIQLEVDPAQRTLTLQRALAAVDAASECDPAPDLILLPAFNEVPATITADKTVGDRIPGATVEAWGQRARHWGVYLAAGFAERGDGRPYVTAALLDADGDIRLIQRQSSFREGLPDYFSKGISQAAADTELGRMTMLVGDDLLDERAWAQAAQDGVGLVLGVAWWASAPGPASIAPDTLRRALTGLAGRYALACAVADVAMPRGDTDWSFPGISLIADAGGGLRASAEVGRAATLWGELEIPPPPAREEHRR